MIVMDVIAGVALFLIVAIAVMEDFIVMKIRNRLIFIGLLLGLAFRILLGEPLAVVHFLVNISFPVIVLFILYLMRVLGAGDIKLFSVIGGFLSFRELADCMILSFAIGAILSLIKMGKEKTIISGLFAGSLYLSGLLSGNFQEYPNDRGNTANKIHFSLPIGIALLIIKAKGAIY